MVETPTFLFGQVQSGKTYRAFRLWEQHTGPAVFANIQWVDYVPASIRCRTAEEVITALSEAKSVSNGPKIDWRLNNYNELDTFVDYALGVHRARHEQGGNLPTLAFFMDEVWRIAGRGADANNSAVRVFTEGYQHRVVGVAMSQWVSQVSKLIPGNSYQFYIFHLWERDYEILRSLYKMEVPETTWLKDYHYWHYDGRWFRGYPDGREVEYATADMQEVSEEPAASETDEPPVSADIQGGESEVDTDGVGVHKVPKRAAKLETFEGGD